MLLPWLAIILGLAVLVWSADRFIDSASAAASCFGVSPLFIGIIVIGFGTSAPELVVSAIAALEGSPALALGNAFGSNIANIGLVLGLAALLYPIATSSSVIRKEILILGGVTLLAGALLLNGHLGRIDAVVLLLGFAVLLAWSVSKSLKAPTDLVTAEEPESGASSMSTGWAVAWLLISLTLLLVSSKLLVWGAAELAMAMGISELVIGLTVVALGTSLPELASVIAAARKSRHDLALGNILGSGLFNTLAVVGLAAMIAPFDFEPSVLYRDWMVMGSLASILCLYTLFQRPAGLRLSRPSGAALLMIYTGYLAWIGVSLAAL